MPDDDDDDMLGGVIASRRAAASEKGKTKPKAPSTGHNSGKDPADAYSVTAEELRQFCERLEQLEVEKKEIADQIKEVLAEAKGRGYDTKVLRKILAMRKRKPDELAEEDAVLQVYMAALGMS